MDAYVGFDSAWTDNPEAPGAICAVCMTAGRPARFYAPRLASFDQALAFIRVVRSDNGNTLIALDQPTVVPNLTGMRQVDRTAASLIGWLGGGVQPANRGRIGMFCDASPIWRFLNELGAVECPEQARVATNGYYLMEVFPALALASLDSGFFGRLRAPKYNPDRETFRPCDWGRVAEAAAREAGALDCEELAEWCRNAGRIALPRKADQDMLDAALCLLLSWRLRSRGESLLLGDLAAGYMVLPASQPVRERLTVAARRYSVSLDGDYP
jgi:predicted RNase H-like nuclease